MVEEDIINLCQQPHLADERSLIFLTLSKQDSQLSQVLPLWSVKQ